MISITIEGLEAAQKMLKNQPKTMSAVLRRAITRAATNAQSNMAKKVREQWGVKSAAVKDSIKVDKGGLSGANPYAIVRVTGDRLGLEKFKISPTQRQQPSPKGGYKVQIHKTGGLKAISRGFLADVSAEGDPDGPKFLYFQRIGKSRLPIRRMTGPSVPQMIKNKSIIEYVEAQAQKMLEARIQHEMEYVLGLKKT